MGRSGVTSSKRSTRALLGDIPWTIPFWPLTRTWEKFKLRTNMVRAPDFKRSLWGGTPGMLRVLRFSVEAKALAFRVSGSGVRVSRSLTKQLLCRQ